MPKDPKFDHIKAYFTGARAAGRFCKKHNISDELAVELSSEIYGAFYEYFQSEDTGDRSRARKNSVASGEQG